MKGGSSSFGEREEDMAFLQPRKTLLLKTADKMWAGYYFCLGACVLSGASLGSPPGVQTFSRRMSRPALRLTCFFSFSAFPKHQPPGGHWTALSLNSYSLFPVWLTCLRLKARQGEKRGSLASFLPYVFSSLTSPNPERFPLPRSFERNEYIVLFSSFLIVRHPQSSLSLLSEKRCGDLSLNSLQYQKT